MKRMASTEKFSLSFQGEKKVNFALSRNKSQDPREYFETLKNSPEIPFDASRKPIQGVLKTNMSQTPAGVKSQKRSRASDFF
uniref:Putative secreted protein n=1 Tax=Ixodes ricinus TaxID=34613 RepID=A0A0K8R667_IXORI